MTKSQVIRFIKSLRVGMASCKLNQGNPKVMIEFVDKRECMECYSALNDICRTSPVGLTEEVDDAPRKLKKVEHKSRSQL